MRRADDDDVAHRAVGVERLVAQDGAFDFFGAHAVAADVDDVVAATMQAEAVVGIAHGKVALGVGPGTAPAGPIGRDPALTVTAPVGIHTQAPRAGFDAKADSVAPHGARQVRIRRGDDDLALFIDCRSTPGHPGRNARGGGIARLRHRDAALRIGVLDPDIPHDPGQGIGVRVGVQREVGITVEVRPDHAAVLGGPVTVDVLRRHQFHAELLHRRAGGFGAEGGNTQAAQVVLLHVAHVLRVGHDGLQESDAGLEDAHAVAFDHRRVAPGVREGRRAFAQDAGAASGHGRAEHVALAGDPPRVGNHVDDIARLRIEGDLHGVRHAGGVAAVHMHHPLGLAGGAAGVDEEQRELSVKRDGRDGGPDGAHEIGIGQSSQRGLVGHGEARLARGPQQRLAGRICQLVAPAVALGPPYQVGLRGMAHYHHRIDPRRRGHQRLGNGGAYARGLGRIQAASAAELAQRPADASHGVAALHRHLSGQGIVDRGQHLLNVGLGQIQGGQTLGNGQAHRGHRHVVIQGRVGVGGLERHDLRIAVAAVRGDDNACAGVVDTVGQRLVTEASEHRRVDDAQPLGALCPVQLLRNIRQVECDAVASLQAETLQCDGAFGGFKQQGLARDDMCIHRRAAAAVLGHVPAVAFEQKGGLGAEAGQHMAVDFVEAGVGRAAFEPLPVRRVVGVEGALPWLVAGPKIGRDRGAAGSVPAGPAATGIVELQPGAGRAHARACGNAGDEPMDLPPCDVTVKRAGVAQGCGALAIPVGAASQGVHLGRRHRRAARRGGCRVVHAWGHGLGLVCVVDCLTAGLFG